MLFSGFTDGYNFSEIHIWYLIMIYHTADMNPLLWLDAIAIRMFSLLVLSPIGVQWNLSERTITRVSSLYAKSLCALLLHFVFWGSCWGKSCCSCSLSIIWAGSANKSNLRKHKYWNIPYQTVNVKRESVTSNNLLILTDEECKQTKV